MTDVWSFIYKILIANILVYSQGDKLVSFIDFAIGFETKS